MRTAVYLGLLYIGDAIRSTIANAPEYPANGGKLLALLFVLFLIMDVFEFLKKIGE